MVESVGFKERLSSERLADTDQFVISRQTRGLAKFLERLGHVRVIEAQAEDSVSPQPLRRDNPQDD
jgi:hypothetical protein